MTDTTPFAAWLAEGMRLAEDFADEAIAYGREAESICNMGSYASADRASMDAARTALRAHLEMVPIHEATREQCAQLVDRQAKIYADKRDAQGLSDPRWDEREARRDAAEWISGEIRAMDTKPEGMA